MKLFTYSCETCGKTDNRKYAKKHIYGDKEYYTCRSLECIQRFKRVKSGVWKPKEKK